MTKKEYIRYFNLEIKFNKILRKYLNNYVLHDNETLDNRPITHSFLASNEILIQYYLTDLSDDFGKRSHAVSFVEFEKIMGFDKVHLLKD